MTGEAAAPGQRRSLSSAGEGRTAASQRSGGGPAMGIPAKGAELRIAQAATRSVRRLFRNR